MVEGMSVEVNVMLSLMRVMRPPPALWHGGVYDSGSFCSLVDVSSRMLFSFM